MTTAPIRLTSAFVGRILDADGDGIQQLNGVTLTGIVVTSAGIDTAEVAATREFASEITANESTGTGYTRLTAVVDTVERTDDNAAWIIDVTIADGIDLSDEPDEGGIWWCLPGASDAVRPLVGFNEDDTGAGNADYTPVYDDGLIQFSVRSLANFTVAGIPFNAAGDIDVATLAAALELELGDPRSFLTLTDAPTTDPADGQVPVWNGGLERFDWGSGGGGAAIELYAEHATTIDLTDYYANGRPIHVIVGDANAGSEADRAHVYFGTTAEVEDNAGTRVTLVAESDDAPGAVMWQEVGPLPAVLADFGALGAAGDLDFDSDDETFELTIVGGVGAGVFTATLTDDFTADQSGAATEVVTQWITDGAPVTLVPAYRDVAGERSVAAALVTTATGTGVTIEVTDDGGGRLGLSALTATDGIDAWGVGKNYGTEGTGKHNYDGSHTYSDHTHSWQDYGAATTRALDLVLCAATDNQPAQIRVVKDRSDATSTVFDNGGTGLTSADVQAAIVEVKDLIGGGSGDVVGPGSSVAGNIAVFDDTSGELIDDSGVAISTDGTMAGNSDAKVPTEKAIRTYTAAQVAALIASAPGALDTLDELAAALGDDASFAATVTTALAGKQPLDSDLTAIAGLSPSNDDFVQRKAGAWVNRTVAQVQTDLNHWWPYKHKIHAASESPTTVTGTWTPTTVSSVGGGTGVSATTNDQSWTWADIELAAGTYDVAFMYRKAAANGIIQPTLNGTNLTTIDTYAVSGSVNNRTVISSVTVAADGRQTLVLTNVNKNGSATNYTMEVQYINFRRTGP